MINSQINIEIRELINTKHWEISLIIDKGVQLDSYIITPRLGWLAAHDQSTTRKPIWN